MRFLGNIDGKIDSKGRVFLPSVFRKVLQASGFESLVLRKDVFQPCLALYPVSVWNATMDELRSRLSRWDSRQQMIFRQFVKDAEVVELDGNGRFLIPKRYLQMAKLSQQARFIGMGDYVEIWPDGDRQFMEPDEFAAALQDIMTDNPLSGKNIQP